MLHNDEPTLVDQLERTPLVVELGDQIAQCNPPYVFGLHGAWGSGKTSFLHQLQFYLTGECPQSQELCHTRLLQKVEKDTEKPPSYQKLCEEEARKLFGEDWEDKEELTVVWFEAWRYQHDHNPIVALLHEICDQLGWKQKMLNKAKKLGEVTIRSSLLTFESIIEMIGIAPSKIQQAGEQWEARHHATPLPTHTIRGLLNEAISQLIGKNKRLVILVDDLDRCEPEAAYRLLEGIKIYLNIPSCLFVIGMDRNFIELAVAEHIPTDNEFNSTLVKEYLEKICQSFWHLPLVIDPAGNLNKWLGDVDRNTKGAIARVINKHDCLPRNPRKIKAFAATLLRFMAIPNTFDPELCIAMAGLYHFHPELYRRIEKDTNFFVEIQKWAYGEETMFKAVWFSDMRLPYFGQSKMDNTPTPQPPTFHNAHLDPTRGDVFWMQKLFIEIEAPVASKIKEYILH